MNKFARHYLTKFAEEEEEKPSMAKRMRKSIGNNVPMTTLLGGALGLAHGVNSGIKQYGNQAGTPMLDRLKSVLIEVGGYTGLGLASGAAAGTAMGALAPAVGDIARHTENRQPFN